MSIKFDEETNNGKYYNLKGLTMTNINDICLALNSLSETYNDLVKRHHGFLTDNLIHITEDKADEFRITASEIRDEITRQVDLFMNPKPTRRRRRKI